MSSGDGQQPTSITEALQQWFDANERYDEQRELNDSKRAAFRSGMDSLRTSGTLRSAVGEHAAAKFQRSGDRARDVIETLTSLLELRNEKLEELQHLVAHANRAESLLRDALAAGQATPDGATLQQRRIRDEQQNAHRRIIQVVGDLTSFETELGRAFGSKILARTRGLVSEYENDGVTDDPPKQLRGNLKRRMQQCVDQAFDYTIVVVESVYNHPELLKLSDADFAAEVTRRTDWDLPGLLGASARTIEEVRCRRAPGTRRCDSAECEERLLHHLRAPEFLRWLRPIGRDGGEGMGPKLACFRLLASMTRMSWRTVQQYINDSEGRSVKTKARPGADVGSADSIAMKLVSRPDWDRMSTRMFLKLRAALIADVERRIAMPTTTPAQAAELAALLRPPQ